MRENSTSRCRLFYLAKMRVYCLSQGKREETLLCLFMVLWSRKVARGSAMAEEPETQDGIAAAVTAIAAAVFFLDATKKYGRIITSFAVVPFALARVARVVKSVDVNSPSPCSARPFFFHGDVDDRVKFLLRQRACLVAQGLAIVSPYTALERRGRRKTNFTSRDRASTQHPH